MTYTNFSTGWINDLNTQNTVHLTYYQKENTFGDVLKKTALSNEKEKRINTKKKEEPKETKMFAETKGKKIVA